MKKLLIVTMCSVLVSWVSAGQTHLVDENLLQRVATILSETSGHYGTPYGGQIVLSYPQRIPLIDSYHTTYALGYASSHHRPSSPHHHHSHGHGHGHGHGHSHGHHASPYDYPPSAHHNDLTSNYGPPY